MTSMPRDGGHPIPVAGLKRGSGAHSVTTSATSAKNSTALDTEAVFVYATEDCYIEFGGSTVVATASSHFLPKSTYQSFAIFKGCTHIAALQVTTGGTLYISETE